MTEPLTPEDDRTDRRRRYRTGLAAETTAAVWLRAKGYRVLGRRVRTSAGEIDLVVTRGRRISFIEVKARRSPEAAEAALPARQRQRVKRASAIWLQQHPRYQDREITFDVVFVFPIFAFPWRMPRHLVNAL